MRPNRLAVLVTTLFAFALAGCSGESSDGGEPEVGEGELRTTDAGRMLAGTVAVEMDVTDLSGSPRKTIKTAVGAPDV